MIIRRATAQDAVVLAELGARTFIETFARRTAPRTSRCTWSSRMGVEQQRREVEEGITLLLEEEGVLIAFAQLYRSESRSGTWSWDGFTSTSPITAAVGLGR
jgi:hypothetical protein